MRAFEEEYNNEVDEYNKNLKEGAEKKAKITSIYMAPDTKRHYPFGNFCAQVLGFGEPTTRAFRALRWNMTNT